MDELDRLYAQLEQELSGYISVKTIYGKKRPYLQKKIRGHLISAYIKPADLPSVKIAIKTRKETERKIKKLERSLCQPLPQLGKSALSFTGSLMMGDLEVARFEDDHLIFLNEALAPAQIKRTHELEGWLASRAIDQHRPHSRLLKKALRIEETDEAYLALKAHGATLSDNYWFKPKHSRLHYSDVAFKADFFSGVALHGEITPFGRKPSLSPELTAIGSYEKCWKLQDGEWWMYKKENDLERFSECFISELGKALGFPMAEYVISGSDIKTKNFAKTVNFEPMSGFLGSDDSLASVFKVCLSLGQSFAKDYLKILYLDALVCNGDRHNENCGFFRDKRTGQYLSLAPNFDNNIALVSHGYLPATSKASAAIVKLFQDFLKATPEAQKLYQEIAWPSLSTGLLDQCFERVPIPIQKEKVKTMLQNTEYLLKGLCQ
jgi:hypothetical protein